MRAVPLTHMPGVQPALPAMVVHTLLGHTVVTAIGMRMTVCTPSLMEVFPTHPAQARQHQDGVQPVHTKTPRNTTHGNTVTLMTGQLVLTLDLAALAALGMLQQSLERSVSP